MSASQRQTRLPSGRPMQFQPMLSCSQVGFLHLLLLLLFLLLHCKRCWVASRALQHTRGNLLRSALGYAWHFLIRLRSPPCDQPLLPIIAS